MNEAANEFDPVRDLATPEPERLSQNSAALSHVIVRREEFYRTVLESLAEGLLITDADSRVVYTNGRMEEITGYSKDELVGRISYELLSPPERWPDMQRRLKERLGGKTEFYENQLVRKDGSTQWISVKATPYRNAAGEIVGTIGALSCIERQKDLELQNEYLLDELRSQSHFGEIIGRSPVLTKVLQQIAVVAPTQAGVLVLGESGTGKELVARAIHDNSPRRSRPLVRVNCAAVPKELFESEFFGHVKGSFTGAIKDRIGRFELADGGTLFLDEIGEVPLDLQGKLLRVLQEGQFEKLGETRTRSVDVRIIAATNRDLETEAKAGRFRLDLFYRLSVFPIQLPPLRERREDILPLAESFVARTVERHASPPVRLSAANRRELEAYDWPGNVRELQNVIERAVILARGGPMTFGLAAPAVEGPRARGFGGAEAAPAAPKALGDLRKTERQMIKDALNRSGGKIYGDDGAAALLGIKPTTLASKLHRWGWKRGSWEAK